MNHSALPLAAQPCPLAHACPSVPARLWGRIPFLQTIHLTNGDLPSDFAPNRFTSTPVTSHRRRRNEPRSLHDPDQLQPSIARQLASGRGYSGERPRRCQAADDLSLSPGRGPTGAPGEKQSRGVGRRDRRKQEARGQGGELWLYIRPPPTSDAHILSFLSTICHHI